MKILIKKVAFDKIKFNQEQLDVIESADSQRIPFDIFEHPNLSADTMRYILDACEELKYSDEDSDGDFAFYYQVIRDMFTEEELDFSTEDADYKGEEVGDRIREMKDVFSSTSRHDRQNRTCAITYIDGIFYETETHAIALNRHNAYNGGGFFADPYMRPDEKEVKEKIDNKRVVFLAHKVDGAGFLESDGTGERKAIYVINEPIWLQNITIEEAANKLKEKYGDFNIYVDDESYIDYKKMKRIYPKLARLKKNINNKMKIMRRKASDFINEKEYVFDEEGYGKDLYQYYAFNPEQREVIDKAKNQGIDLAQYSNNQMSADELSQRSLYLYYIVENIPNFITDSQGLESVSTENLQKILNKIKNLNNNLQYQNQKKLELKKEDLDFSLDLDMNLLFEKIENIMYVINTKSNFDIERRTYAFVYIGDTFYVGESHSECLDSYKKEKNKYLKERFMKWRPGKKELDENIEENEIMFAGHILDGDKDIKEQSGVRKEQAIYLINNPVWLRNIDVYGAAKIIKESSDYKTYRVYLDDTWTINFQEEVKEYTRLAKLKQRKQLLKLLYG